MEYNLSDLKRVLDYGSTAIREDASVTGKLLKYFTDVYYSFFGEVPKACTDCSGGFEQSFTRASNYYTNKLKNPNYMENQKKECQFKIKGGGVINSVHGNFTQGDLTDEKVFHLLKAEPNMINCFEKSSIPKDLNVQMETFFGEEEEKAEKENEKDANDLTLKTKKELQAIATEKNLPAEEWEKLNRTDLLTYLEGK